ncbi:hypothetical protein T484DRAFT_1822578 [Baffinella frigidus]|nr:hypothetical protein T484DRAFT_1822578 [Cryptophyta sp. CCMP2293]
MAEEASAALENLAVTDEAVGSLATPTGSLGSPTGSYDVADDDEEEEETGISAQLGVFLDSSGEKQILGRFEERLFQFLEDETSNLKVADEGEEQSLELYAAFQKFQAVFDGEMAAFMESSGIGSTELLFKLMEEETNKSARATKFFDGLMASMEYDSFCNLARNFQAAAANEDSDDDDDDDSESEGEAGEGGA